MASMDIFSSLANPNKSFKMHRRSPLATKLKATVSEKLIQFLDDHFTDDVLAEYIVVLVCNGKHQNQAKDELEAFLGDKTEEFVSWLWAILSKIVHQPYIPNDLSNPKDAIRRRVCGDAVDNDQRISRLRDLQNHVIERTNTLLSKEEKAFLSTSAHKPVPLMNNEVYESCQQSRPEFDSSIDVKDAKRLCLGKFGSEGSSKSGSAEVIHNATVKHGSSRVKGSSEILAGGDQIMQYVDQRKIDNSNCNELPHQLLQSPKRELVSRKLPSVGKENPQARPIPVTKFAGTRLSTNSASQQNAKPRGNVWDRLGKPYEENTIMGRSRIRVPCEDNTIMRRSRIGEPYKDSTIMRRTRIREPWEDNNIMRRSRIREPCEDNTIMRKSRIREPCEDNTIMRRSRIREPCEDNTIMRRSRIREPFEDNTIMRRSRIGEPYKDSTIMRRTRIEVPAVERTIRKILAHDKGFVQRKLTPCVPRIRRSVGEVPAHDNTMDVVILDYRDEFKQLGGLSAVCSPHEEKNSSRKRQFDEIDPGDANRSASLAIINEKPFQVKETLEVNTSSSTQCSGSQGLNNVAAETRKLDATSTSCALRSPDIAPSLKDENVSQSKLIGVATNFTPQALVADISPLVAKLESINNEKGVHTGLNPVNSEMLDPELRLLQNESEVSKLCSEKIEMSNGDQVDSLSSSGTLNIPEEDNKSRTVFVKNVHFGASKESLSSHFARCGLVVQVIMLTDPFTGRPKGSAYITFANKESVDKAVTLSGSSFWSRILTVVRESEMPAVTVEPAQLAQTWFPQSNRMATFQRPYSRSHLQWRRDQQVNTDNSVSTQGGGGLEASQTADEQDAIDSDAQVLPRSLTYVRSTEVEST